MPQYISTTKGERLAVETGLDVLAQRLHNQVEDLPLQALERLTDLFDSTWFEEDDEALSAEINAARDRLKTFDERVMFDRALAIDTERDSWRQLGDIETDTLFPVQSVRPFTGAFEGDSLILSGMIGLSLLNFRNHYPLLARDRYQDYGFRTFNEACAFVGAYVAGKQIDLDRSPSREAPYFEYIEADIIHSISVGATIDGDFRISDVRLPASGIVSPIHTLTEFSPAVGVEAAGYHSIEPNIVAALIEAEIINSGKEAAQKLVEEFEAIVNEVSDNSGAIDYTEGNFGDYGISDTQLTLMPLSTRLNNTDPNKLASNNTLLSEPYLPQSSLRFEILQTDAGVEIRNRQLGQTIETSSIQLSRKHFGDLFRALIEQSSGGLGRSAPYQLVELIVRAKALLENKDSEEA